MKTIYHLLRKEFRQIFRNRAMLPILFVMPAVQLLVLSFAATFEVRNIRLHIVDNDQSTFSRELTNKFLVSDHFTLTGVSFSGKVATDDMQRYNTDVILHIPAHFERDLVRNQQAQLLLAINAIDGAAAAVENVYATSIIQDFNENIRIRMADEVPLTSSRPKVFSVSQSFWFNPELDYKTFMVPGILVLLITMIAVFLAGMNIVREKEIGTLEQINVTPIKKHQFIIGKLLPFWLLALVELGLGLLMCWIIFGIGVAGSIWLIFLFASVYLLVVLGIGFFISNFANTQQQAMFLSWFFMVIFILMSGLFTPIESMPSWAQVITEFNPVRYFVEVMRMVMLKSAELSDILPQLTRLLVYALVMNGLAVAGYKKVA
ncbi:MAG: ABC transporter permease [Cyclobacteriaceae bacterium]|jgi:ABC-2 type transport system permease protein|nr:ABC transporter permease [Cyclobacteriaceae bacterium]